MMNQMNTKQTLNMVQCPFLEGLYDQKLITDYTDDGWVQLNSDAEWYPTKFACKQLGEKVYNEYIEYCGQGSW